MKEQILIIGRLKDRINLIRKVKKALRQKYRLVFYSRNSRDNLNLVVKNSLVIIIDDFNGATTAAKEIKRGYYDIEKPIIFISSKEKFRENFKKYTNFITIGHNWKLCVVDDEFLDVVESAINLSHQSHKIRTTLHSLGKQLEDPKTVPEHVPYYRKLLEVEKNVKEKNIELLKANNELKRLDQLKNLFLNMTSHELKTPITPIKMAAQSLIDEMQGKLNLKQRESAKIILRNINHLNDLLTDVLDSAKLEAGNLKMFPEKTNLKHLIKETIKDIELKAIKENLTITTAVEKLPIVLIDSKRFKQVLLNLLSNSIKFTSHGGKLTISAKQQNKEIVVIVSDTGIGISKEMISKVFDKFVQVSPSFKLKQKGTGLGLTICKGIVTQFGGKIWAQSKGKDKGTSFYFTIPIKQKA